MKAGSRTSLINSRRVGRSKPNCESATDIATSEEENASSTDAIGVRGVYNVR